MPGATALLINLVLSNLAAARLFVNAQTYARPRIGVFCFCLFVCFNIPGLVRDSIRVALPGSGTAAARLSSATHSYQCVPAAVLIFVCPNNAMAVSQCLGLRF